MDIVSSFDNQCLSNFFIFETSVGILLKHGFYLAFIKIYADYNMIVHLFIKQVTLKQIKVDYLLR